MAMDTVRENLIKDNKSKKERLKKRKESMNKEELLYLRRKQIFDKVWPFFRFLIIAGLCFVILYPLIFMISCAFREQSDMNDPTVMWIPRNLTLSVIKETATAMKFDETIINTLKLNIGCSFVQVITSAITGYGFARFKFKGRNILFAVVIMMILVPSQIILIPQYMQFRYFDFLGLFKLFTGDTINLINTAWTMYLPAFTANGIRAGLMILIFRQFFKGMPKELEDAAYLDGCGPFRTFVVIMIPNALSSFLTVFLFSVVWYWNDYYVSNSFFTSNQTIALMLKNIDTVLKMALFNDASLAVSARQLIVWMQAGCLISIAPMLILYIVLQKHFTEGVERSGLVG